MARLGWLVFQPVVVKLYYYSLWQLHDCDEQNNPFGKLTIDLTNRKKEQQRKL